jgi:hypothetical protein
MPFEPDETTMIDLAAGVRPPGAALTTELAAELHARSAGRASANLATEPRASSLRRSAPSPPCDS